VTPIIEQLFPYFPAVSARKLSKLNEASMFGRLVPRLKAINDPQIFKIFLKHIPNNARSQLVDMVSFYLKESANVPTGTLFQFCQFLNTISTTYQALITVFILDLPRDIAIEFLQCALKDSAFSTKYAVQLSSLSTKLMVEVKLANFDKLTESERVFCVKQYAKGSASTDLSEQIVAFGLEHLRGWTLERFKWKCQLENVWETRAFNARKPDDDIGNLIRYNLAIDNADHLPSLLCLSIVRNVKFDFSADKISDNCVLVIINFLMSHRLPLVEFRNKSDAAKPWLIANAPVPYISSLLESERLRRREIFMFCRAVVLFREEHSEIFALLTKILGMQRNERFLAASLGMATIVFEKYRSIPESFVHFFFDLLQQKAENLPTKETSLALLSLSARLPFDAAQSEFLRLLFGWCGFLSTEMSILMSAMLSTFPNPRQALTALADIPSQYLEYPRPSHFLGALRILSQCLHLIRPEDSLAAIEPCLPKILAGADRLKSVQPINFIAAQFLRTVLLQAIPSLHRDISNKVSAIIRATEMPSFCEYSSLLQPLVLALEPAPIMAMMDDFVPVNAKFLFVMIDVIDTKLSKLSTDGERVAELAKRLERFAQFARGFDSYDLRLYFVAWIRLLKKHFGLKKAFELIVTVVLPSARRFFPAFCAFAKEVDQERADHFEWVHQSIARAMIQETSDTRICAFEMLSRDSKMREVLDIALLDSDVL
jgi:hypothetical protein